MDRLYYSCFGRKESIMNEKNIYNYWNQLFEELGINQFIFHI